MFTFLQPQFPIEPNIKCYYAQVIVCAKKGLTGLVLWNVVTFNLVHA